MSHTGPVYMPDTVEHIGKHKKNIKKKFILIYLKPLYKCNNPHLKIDDNAIGG